MLSEMQMQSVRQAAIETELLVTKQVVTLASFGARPTMIAEILGKRVALTEIKRIFRLASQRETNAGRIPDARKIFSCRKSDQATLARLLENYSSATTRGFEPVDAMLATWRVHLQALTAHEALRAEMPVDFELFLVAVRHLKAGRIELRRCQHLDCLAPNIFGDSHHALCSTCNRRVDPLNADAVRGEVITALVTPAYRSPKPRVVKAA